MSDFLFLLMVAGIVVGVIIALVLRYFIFIASCALVDVEPSTLKSILIVLFALSISLIIGVPMYYFGLSMLNPQTQTSLYILWWVLTLALVWAVLGLLYIPALPVPFKKGLLLSAYEIVLGALANALLIGAILVVFATVQILTKTNPNQGTQGRSARVTEPPFSLVSKSAS
jgi:hypothetical protein